MCLQLHVPSPSVAGLTQPPTRRTSQNVLYQEIDYMNEGTNAELFRKNFAGTPWVKVPEVFWEKSGQRVLCMEYCPGLKINRVEEIERRGLDRALLARYSVEAYLQQILRYGFFHADPHPGNIAVDDGAPGGRLIFYDFGMMGTIRPGIRGGLLELFYAVYEKDANKCLDALVTMGALALRFAQLLARPAHELTPPVAALQVCSCRRET